MARHGTTQQSTAHAMGVAGEDGYPGRRRRRKARACEKNLGWLGLGWARSGTLEGQEDR